MARPGHHGGAALSNGGDGNQRETPHIYSLDYVGVDIDPGLCICFHLSQNSLNVFLKKKQSLVLTLLVDKQGSGAHPSSLWPRGG